jgi:hypothetical protein
MSVMASAASVHPAQPRGHAPWGILGALGRPRPLDRHARAGAWRAAAKPATQRDADLE